MQPRAVDLRFDVVWFGGPRSSPLRAEHFDRLNRRGRRGHFLVMPTTEHQDEVEARGNLLAQYYAELNQVRKGDPTYPVVTSGQMADRILREQHAQGFHSGWIFLNEISSRFWPSDPAYRRWLIDVASRIARQGYSPVVWTPFPAPPRNGDDWKALSDVAYIAAENYLGGHLIAAQGANAQAWCEERYQLTKTHYTGHGVPESRLFLTEHFGHTKQVRDIRRGRCSLPLPDWLDAIDARAAAARKVGFGGFVSFAWMYNQMKAPEEALLQCTDRYLAARLP